MSIKDGRYNVEKGICKAKDILAVLDELAPFQLAESWDNIGLLVGDSSQDIRKILVCLDVTNVIIKKAIAMKIDMVIAHHPLIFKNISHLCMDMALSRRLRECIKNDIAIIAMHTNLDSAIGGVNDVLAHRLGLNDISSFDAPDTKEAGLGRIGTLKDSMSPYEFSLMVKKSLKASYVRLANAGEHKIKKIALCSGAGASLIKQVASLGVDAYVTGDVSYHQAQDAVDLGIHLVDAGHFATEFPIVDELAKLLRSKLPQLEIISDTEGKDIFEIL